MKTCRSCGTQYADDTLSFCLQDGTPLTEADTPTVILGETETFTRSPGASAWQPSEFTRVQMPQQVKRSSNTVVAVVLTVGAMLVLFGIAGIAAFLYFGPDGPLVANANTASNTSLNTPSPQSSPWSNISVNALAANKRGAETPTRPSPVPSPTAERTPPPRVLSSYPATTRLRFARGAVSTSFSGDINPGGNRSLVLFCRAGQSLSAQLTGGSSCVSIRGGGTSFRTITTRGDNYITLTNICSQVARFSISITVL